MSDPQKRGSILRTIVLLVAWSLFTLLVGPWLLLYALITGNANPLFHGSLRMAQWGLRIAGIRPEIKGLENLKPGQNYIFMSSHVSNLDPPVLIPLIPGRSSVLVKKELFRAPILGPGMKIADLVPVDRSNREAAIESVNAATAVLRKGLHMVIYPEGTRSPDGKLLPFKKGPFFLAEESGVPVIPVTMLGTFESWPKKSFALRAGTCTAVLHPPIDPRGYPNREALMDAVADAIDSALPPERRAAPRRAG